MSVEEGRNLVEKDWLVNSRSDRLHHAGLTNEQYLEMSDNSQLEETAISLTCGRTMRWPSIPGLFSRLGMQRCRQCCARLGYPRGKGSPKNDETCRQLLDKRTGEETR